MRVLRRDLALGLLVGSLALALYLRTLYPGLVGDGDTPKFQYVGAVGGTPHNPGYPLYLLLSYAFSRLPCGNLAWRINLLSAVCGALAAALLALALRALDCGRAVAAAVALAAACGPVLWSQATLAEVYTLAAALLLGVLSALLQWARPPHADARLLLAAAVFGLALGHHLTIVTVLPALVAFALLVDRRAALRPRLLGLAAAFQVLGLCQYLLILVRTRRGAPYLGSQARTLGELWDVVRAAQFSDRLFAFDLPTVLRERLPRLLAFFPAELGWVGLALAIAGLGRLARRRQPAGLLLALGIAGVLAFALNYRVDDPEVFLIPAFLLLWLAAGVGLQGLLEALGRPLAGRPRLFAALALLIAAALPAGQLRAHWKASDHSARTFEMRYFAAVTERVPSGSVFLAESYTVDQMLLYELLGEGRDARRGLRLGPRDRQSVEAYARRGLPVFAFERARQELAGEGLRFEPVRLEDGPLPETLARLPAGVTVLLAAATPGPGLRAAAGSLGAHVPEDAPAFVLIATVGVPPAELRTGNAPLELGAPGSYQAGVEGGTARVAAAGVELAHSTRGAAVAWLNPGGRVIEALDLDARGALGVPFGRRAFPLFRLAALPDGRAAPGGQ